MPLKLILLLTIDAIAAEKEDFVQWRCTWFSLLTIDTIAIEKEDFV